MTTDLLQWLAIGGLVLFCHLRERHHGRMHDAHIKGITKILSLIQRGAALNVDALRAVQDALGAER